ncbi:hypothetical protein [Yoonia vestfoldensis]|uniref:Sulfotransferase family protein n=1 Tax=Yoonia vestfoldensis TaxID=245188 RepID=A0A1Y0E854_9RHOB|nr:hypothetical protein [Yoonia vestfoldensis]ART99561.1 hypothetical protein LOKVESSMR4R_00220 [Yoonia vestfoldensis]
MLNPALSVAFHIGAHKTATSHLQRSIGAEADALAAQGVHWFGPRYLRKWDQTLPDLARLNDGHALSGPLGSLLQTAQRVVLSEENHIGVLNDPRRKPVTCRYPKAAQRIGAVAQGLGRDIDVFLAIRQPTRFVNAAYCQQLMGGKVIPMAQYRKINPLQSVDWADLVARLRAASGVGRLVVWCYEDYATHFNAICAGLLGPAAAALVRPIAHHIHRSLSAAAVAEILHRHALGGSGDLGVGLRGLLPVEDGYPPFDGFTRAEHAAGDASYRAQIAAIGAMPGVTLLDPLWAAGPMRA